MSKKLTPECSCKNNDRLKLAIRTIEGVLDGEFVGDNWVTYRDIVRADNKVLRDLLEIIKVQNAD